jgi:hypothetical protein
MMAVISVYLTQLRGMGSSACTHRRPHAKVMKRTTVTIDGNGATAYGAHKTNEVIAIYPNTVFRHGELADQWSSEGRPNI